MAAAAVSNGKSSCGAPECSEQGVGGGRDARGNVEGGRLRLKTDLEKKRWGVAGKVPASCQILQTKGCQTPRPRAVRASHLH